MQEAIPYKTWQYMATSEKVLSKSTPFIKSINSSSISDNLGAGAGAGAAKRDLKEIVRENAVIVFGKRGCCMSHVIKRLLQGLGVNPPVFEVDEKDENGVINELEMLIGAGKEKNGGRLQFPAVFLGGRLFGGLDRIMSTHITGELTPELKKAGALWL